MPSIQRIDRRKSREASRRENTDTCYPMTEPVRRCLLLCIEQRGVAVMSGLGSRRRPPSGARLKSMRPSQGPPPSPPRGITWITRLWEPNREGPCLDKTGFLFSFSMPFFSVGSTGTRGSIPASQILKEQGSQHRRWLAFGRRRAKCRTGEQQETSPSGAVSVWHLLRTQTKLERSNN